jgi:hypothetical protein
MQGHAGHCEHILVSMKIVALIKPVSKMRRPHLLISVAWLLHVAAWFLPVVKGVGGGQIDPIPGLAAFVGAAGTVWDGGFSEWYSAVLATASVATTLFFIVGSPWVALRGSPSLRRASAWAAATAFVVNAHWYVLLRPDGWVSDLGIGYFLWWWSFVLLAIGLFDLAGGDNAVESTQRPATLLPR